MKKLLSVFVTLLLVLVLAGCSGSKETLYVLNWGEYMDMDLVAQFEDEFNVKVVYDEVGSNEEMEVRIKSATTKYDIVFPSDFMVDKLRQQGLLNEIDFDLLPALDEVSIMDDAKAMYENEAYAPYMVPYFWGTIGILYNIDTVDEADLTGWDIMFEPNDYKVGMYDSARDSAAAAFMYLGYNVNTNVASEIDEAEAAMINAGFDLYAEENLKKLVITENLDLALVYSGDYLDEYYAADEEGTRINFNYFVPDITNIWIDSFVIPTISENVELAHEFINFFLGFDVATANAEYVGYCPVIQEVFDLLATDEYGYNIENYYPFPEGTNRVMYRFISDERFNRLNQLLSAAKSSN
ncbi:MAG: extracellular solute-binding protein [Bacilli bacterium]|nr:extracellular solute-binding protein [Bacilli bacterium]